ncbi:MAG: acyl-ACP thioesterase domain-containing protein [Desulfobacter sp.]
MQPTDVFSRNLTLPYSAINANGKIKADWLLNIFQDAASHQCHQFGVSGFDMVKKQLKWVVAQYQIRIHDQRQWLAPVRLDTWRAPWKNLYEVRQFSLVAQDETPLVTATGIWILIRAANGKPVRLTPHMPQALMQSPAPDTPLLVKPSGEFDDYHHETSVRVRFLDLDLNQHVNNRVYLRWAVEALPEPHCFAYTPARCTVSYLREGLYGHTLLNRIRLNFTDAGLSTAHAIIHKDTMKMLARISIEWDKIQPLEGLAPHGS